MYSMDVDQAGWCKGAKMIGPPLTEPQPHRVAYKRKTPPLLDPEPPAAKRVVPQPPRYPQNQPSPAPALQADEVCNYETISDYMQLLDQGSPASLESGYQGSAPEEDEDSNLSWLLNFKVSSLFDPTDVKSGHAQPPQPQFKKEETCQCAGSGSYHRGQPGKPPFTYTELIEKALKEQGQLTVSGIYTWISLNYPFYSPNDDRWKNSVRHNLSINPHFRKGAKSRHGAGHLWTLSDQGVDPPPDTWRKAQEADEAATAAATIMHQLNSECPDDPDPDSPESIATPPPEPSLTRAAGEILSGVKRQVEVQYLVNDQLNNAPAYAPSYEDYLGKLLKNKELSGPWPDHTIVIDVPDFHASTPTTSSNQPSSWYSFLIPEFLNPVSKEELVSESGLDTTHCESASSLFAEFNTDLHLPDNLFSDDLSFTCYAHL